MGCREWKENKERVTIKFFGATMFKLFYGSYYGIGLSRTQTVSFGKFFRLKLLKVYMLLHPGTYERCYFIARIRFHVTFLQYTLITGV